MVFLKKRHPLFVLSGYNKIDTLSPLCLRSAFVLPSLWVRSASTPKIGDMENPKWKETDPDITYPFVG